MKSHALPSWPAADGPPLSRLVQGLAAWDAMRLWEAGTKLVLSLLIVTILLALAGGAVRTFLDLRLLWLLDAEVALRRLLVNALTLLAIVEVLKTTLTYWSEGRVRVTYIVDTVLVVMLTEVISRWFSGGDWRQFATLGAVLLTLGLTRIVAVRYSPTPGTAGTPLAHSTSPVSGH